MNDLPPRGRNIKLIIAYNGTRYLGWQRQGRAGGADHRTVQGELETALEKLHKHRVILTGSGRTDSGVHAAAQAANFYTDIAGMEARRFVPALNSLLPHDIRIREAEEVPAGFHARFDARSRLYRYYFICGRETLPSESAFALRLYRRPGIALLNAYARCLYGEMDCSMFAGSKDSSVSKTRYIYAAYFFMEAGKLVFEIRANAFLWKMVRSAAGTILSYEERKTSPEEFLCAVNSGRRELAGPTLPPHGLFLWKVDY